MDGKVKVLNTCLNINVLLFILTQKYLYKNINRSEERRVGKEC